MIDTALEIGANPRVGLVDKVVASQAAHRVRADLQNRAQLMGVQRELVRGLENLDDPALAYRVATTALTEYRASQSGARRIPEFDDLSAAVLRLAPRQEPRQSDPVIAATINAAATGGAAVGLEARIWAAIDLLGLPDQRDRALHLSDQVAAELNSRDDLGVIGSSWRLKLAFSTGRAGYPAITQELLAPILNASGPSEYEDAAREVLRAVGRPGADTRLQLIGLEAELAALPPDADEDRLRVLGALTIDYANLGDFRRALGFGRQELRLRGRTRGPDDPYTLRTRNFVAWLTGQNGNPAKALRLFCGLLPDQVRILGPDHPRTLNTRSNIAWWTGVNGNPAGALRLFRELLPDQVRILGPDHPLILKTRNNIAGWTGGNGNLAEALRLFLELLPDQVRILGPEHPDTLTTRNNIATFTERSGCHPPASWDQVEVFPAMSMGPPGRQ